MVHIDHEKSLPQIFDLSKTFLTCTQLHGYADTQFCFVFYLYDGICVFSNLAFNRIFFLIFNNNTAVIRMSSHVAVQR